MHKQVLPQLDSLQRILLSDNRLGDDSCATLCDAIAQVRLNPTSYTLNAKP